MNPSAEMLFNLQKNILGEAMKEVGISPQVLMSMRTAGAQQPMNYPTPSIPQETESEGVPITEQFPTMEGVPIQEQLPTAEVTPSYEQGASEEVTPIQEQGAGAYLSEGKVAYHGTNKEFNEFKISTVGDLGKGFYHTEDITSAQRFAWSKSYAKGGKQNIIKSQLNIENPLILGTGEDGKLAQKIYDSGSSIKQTGGEIKQLAKSKGYDAVIRESNGTREIVVFDKKKIKIIGQATPEEAYTKL